MKISELHESYISGRIEKKVYWKLLREKFLPLLEYQTLMGEMLDGSSIEITKDDVILNYDKIRISFDFQQTFSRAEVILGMGANPEQDDFNLIGYVLKKGGVVFDIGANVGVFSLSLVAHCPSVDKIYAFEPIPSTYQKMIKNLSYNHNPKQIFTYNVGLSDKSGSFDFFLPGENEAASLKPVTDAFYLQESIDGIYTGQKKSERVLCKVSTVDEFVCDNPQTSIDLLKIDVEGNEKFVLEGAASVLKRYKPIVYTEMLRKHAARFQYHPNDIIEFMRSLGYQCYICVNNELVEFKKMDDSTVETNFFFCHQEKHQDLLQSYMK